MRIYYWSIEGSEALNFGECICHGSINATSYAEAERILSNFPFEFCVEGSDFHILEKNPACHCWDKWKKK